MTRNTLQTPYLLNGILNEHVSDWHENPSEHGQHGADDSTSDEPTVPITAHFLTQGKNCSSAPASFQLPGLIVVSRALVLALERDHKTDA